MNLIENWREVLKKAWSVRFILLAAFLSALEVALPILQDALVPTGLIPRGTFALLSAIATAGALVARVWAQPKAKLGESE